MGNSTYLYKRLAFWLIILVFNSCIQKQDALIISANNSEPFVQVRCILVPGFPAQVHSKKVLFNLNQEWQGNIKYKLTGSDGSADSVVILENNYNEYFTFTNIAISEGVMYSLQCISKEEKAVQKTYIPNRIKNVLYSQMPYEEGSLSAQINVEGSNTNNVPVYAVNPVSSKLFNTSMPNMTLYGDTSQNKSGSSLSLNSDNGNFKTQTLQLDEGQFYKESITFKQNVYTSYNRYFDEINGVQFVTPFHLSDLKRYSILYQEEDSNRSFQNALVLCDENSYDLIKNIPEKITAESIPPFSNVPAFPLNIQNNSFKGYLIGYTFSIPPVVRVTDLSEKLSKIVLVQKDGSVLRDNKINYLPIQIQLNYKRNQTETRQSILTLYGYGVTKLNSEVLLSQFKEDERANSFELKQLHSYDIITDKITIYEGRFGSFQTADQLISFLRENNTLTFYEK